MLLEPQVSLLGMQQHQVYPPQTRRLRGARVARLVLQQPDAHRHRPPRRAQEPQIPQANR